MTKIAIIGAGPSGLTAAKACLEVGLDPWIFEASDRMGGVWQGSEGQAWQGMKTNLSRWSCMFSDFDWPASFAESFPVQKDMQEYLQAYADNFHVTERINFRSPVMSARQSQNGWIITANNKNIQFDKLIVASGFFTSPDISPQGADIIHAADFKTAADFQGRHVTVIGGSFSGYEIAAELARNDINTTHIMRKPAWVLTRTMNGQANDLIFNTRQGRDKPVPFPGVEDANRIQAQFFNAAFGNPGNIHPEMEIDVLSGRPNFVAISDDYGALVAGRKLDIRVSDIKSINPDNIVLSDGREVGRDIVIMATGYKSRLDFLPEDMRQALKFDQNDQFMPLPLHKTVWPEAVDNLAFVGFYRGPYFGVMELQARWAAGVFSGQVRAPKGSDIAEGVVKAMILRNLNPKPQFPYSDYIGMCDDIADEIGVLPLLDETDPLQHYLNHGTVIPAQYRLHGLHANRKEAEKIISTLPVPSI